MSLILRLSFILLTSVFVFSFALAKSSHADVLISDMRITGTDGSGQTSGFLDIGSNSFSYELLFCGIESDGNNPFNTPVSGTWTELNNSTCDGPSCHLGIWGRAAGSGQSGDVTCSWADETRAFAAGSIRFEGVDTSDPIIDIACSEFEDGLFTLETLSSEPGAQIVSVQLGVRSGSTESEFVEFTSLSGAIANAINYTDNRILSLGANSRIDPDGEGQEGFAIPPLLDIFETKFCVLSLRMAKRNIPTMSEWGLIATAGIMGILALIVLRKRKSLV